MTRPAETVVSRPFSGLLQERPRKRGAFRHAASWYLCGTPSLRTGFVKTMDTSVAALIDHAEKGDKSAADALFTLLYAELRRLARIQLARSSGESTLGTTTLLHEAYLRMSAGGPADFPDRARFMAYAARAMRGLILNHARDRRAQKRGGDVTFLPLDDAPEDPALQRLDLEQVAAAMDELAVVEPRLAQVVDLKFFCGFSFAEIAAMWGVSERTVQRDWESARIFLHGMIAGVAE
jgi:RNA polymerase sigma factor (TIGR02999 family)